MAKLRMRLKHEIPSDYKADVTRIVRSFAEFGMIVSEADVYEAWQRYSHAMEMSWMPLPNETRALVDTIWHRFEHEH